MLVPEENKQPVVHWFRDDSNAVTMKIEMSPNGYNSHGYIDSSPNTEEISRLEQIAKEQFGVDVTYIESAELL